MTTRGLLFTLLFLIAGVISSVELRNSWVGIVFRSSILVPLLLGLWSDAIRKDSEKR